MRWVLLALSTQLACESMEVPDVGPAEDASTDAGYALDTGIAPFDAGDPEGTHASLSCERDEHCGDGPNLHCDLMIQRGVCAAFCQDSADQVLEQMECDGPGATCLSSIPGGQGNCSRACEARMADCPPNMVCTGFWYSRAILDAPGCLPFCREGRHCADGRCNPRIGACGFELDLSLKADGEPCDLLAANECRGSCFLVIDGNPTGVCGSFIDVSRDTECPDFPERTTPITVAREDVAICANRSCTDSSECPAPLTCQPYRAALACLP